MIEFVFDLLFPECIFSSLKLMGFVTAQTSVHSEEMIKHVYGFSLESLHSEAEEMLEQLQVAKSKFQKQLSVQDTPGNNPTILDDREKTLRLEHVNTRLGTGKYYSVTKSDGSTLAFQVICKRPERRAYIQRICLMGQDVAQFAKHLLIFDSFATRCLLYSL